MFWGGFCFDTYTELVPVDSKVQSCEFFNRTCDIFLDYFNKIGVAEWSDHRDHQKVRMGPTSRVQVKHQVSTARNLREVAVIAVSEQIPQDLIQNQLIILFRSVFLEALSMKLVYLVNE